MKKFILYTLLCLMSVSAFAQETYYAYCDICVSNDNRYNFLMKHAQLYFDFGEKKVADLLDEDGNVIDFYSYVAAISYLAKQGWRLKNTYTLKTYIPFNEALGKEFEFMDILHCVMEKQVTSDDERFAGLRVKFWEKEKKAKEELPPITDANGKRKIVLPKRRAAYTDGADGEK